MHSRRSLRTLQPLPLPMKNLINSRFVLCESDRKTHGSAFARPETNLCFCEKVRLNRLHRRQFFRVGCRNALHQQSIFMTFVPPGANQTIRAKLHPFKRCHVEKSGVRRLPRFFSHCKNQCVVRPFGFGANMHKCRMRLEFPRRCKRDFGEHADIDSLFLFATVNQLQRADFTIRISSNH